MPILLVRHGETAANAAAVVQLPEEPLSSRGLLQAGRVACRIVEGPQGSVSRIISSDLERAAMTATAVADAAGIEVELQPLLRERSFGDLRGRSYAEIGVDIMAEGYVPPAGESWEQFHLRVAEAWEWLLSSIATGGARESSSSETTVVVTHGLVCHSLASRHLTLPQSREPPRRWGNASLTAIESRPPWRVGLLNCTAHLEGQSADDQHTLSGI